MKKKAFTIGVDVSRDKLDIYCQELDYHFLIQNDDKGFLEFSKFLTEKQIDFTQVFVVMENTGGYEHSFITYLHLEQIKFCRVHAFSVKLAAGLARGKNDKVDAKRIAKYGDEKHKELMPEEPKCPILKELKSLLTSRKKIAIEKSGCKSFISERQKMFKKGTDDFLIQLNMEKIQTCERHIKMIENEIKKHLKSVAIYYTNYKLLISIKGIGLVNAVMAIVYTENFEGIKDPRRYASYIGIAPFDHQSGKSINRPRRVSHMCRKDIKSELTNAARSAAQHSTEMKIYLERKMNEGKSYGTVLNAIKFKLVTRMFAIVKKGVMYVDNYQNLQNVA